MQGPAGRPGPPGPPGPPGVSRSVKARGDVDILVVINFTLLKMIFDCQRWRCVFLAIVDTLTCVVPFAIIW